MAPIFASSIPIRIISISEIAKVTPPIVREEEISILIQNETRTNRCGSEKLDNFKAIYETLLKPGVSKFDPQVKYELFVAAASTAIDNRSLESNPFIKRVAFEYLRETGFRERGAERAAEMLKLLFKLNIKDKIFLDTLLNDIWKQERISHGTMTGILEALVSCNIKPQSLLHRLASISLHNAKTINLENMSADVYSMRKLGFKNYRYIEAMQDRFLEIIKSLTAANQNTVSRITRLSLGCTAYHKSMAQAVWQTGADRLEELHRLGPKHFDPSRIAPNALDIFARTGRALGAHLPSFLKSYT